MHQGNWQHNERDNAIVRRVAGAAQSRLGGWGDWADVQYRLVDLNKLR